MGFNTLGWGIFLILIAVPLLSPPPVVLQYKTVLQVLQPPFSLHTLQAIVGSIAAPIDSDLAVSRIYYSFLIVLATDHVL